MKLKSYVFSGLIALITSLLISTSASGQIIMNPLPAQNLVEDVLAGSGVQVFNVTFNGDPQQMGVFSNSLADSLGIPSGVVMTSGNIPEQYTGAVNGVLINQEDFGTLSSGGQNSIMAQNDPDLNAILISYGVPPPFEPNQYTNNVSTLEFDFIPSGDSLAFTYVFGSEEYESYVCSQFFDVFGFFLSGPGINGTYTNGAENLAIIPNTNLAVGINTVNDGVSDGGQYCPPDGLSNSEFYHGNPASAVFSVNGFTYPLVAQATVQCGETYHIKLVIANGTDQALDSWVFLKAGSFSSSIPNLFTANLLQDSSVVEGCTEAPLIFTRNNDQVELIISIEYTGSAENGVDYTLLPDTLIFPIGTDTLEYLLQPLNDGLTEGFETVTISFNVINDCGETIFITRTLKIRDPYDLVLTSSDTTLSCPDTDFSVGVSVTGGYAPYNYSWNNNTSNDSLLVTPITETTAFTVEISDSLDCQLITYIDTVVVTLNYDSLVSKSEAIIVCEGFSDTLGISVLFGLAPYEISWAGFGQMDSLMITAVDTINYIYTVTDACDLSVSDTVTVNVPNYDPIIVTASDTTICKNTSAILSGQAEGGNGDYSYVWAGPIAITNFNDSVSASNPITTTDFILTVTDGCLKTGSDTLTVTVENCELLVGNAFSPNGDGINDFFLINNIEFFPNNIVYLFNRWGNKILEQPAYVNNWSGENITAGTYFYVVDPGDGTEFLKGYVTVFKD